MRWTLPSLAHILPDDLAQKVREWQICENRTGHSSSQVYRLVPPTGQAVYLKVQYGATGSLQPERRRLAWLQGKLPVPSVLYFGVRGPYQFLLMSEVPGLPASDPACLQTPEKLAKLLATGLRAIHALAVDTCPFRLQEDQGRGEGDLVVCHGDYSLPNVLVSDGAIRGFIDLGQLGVGDRYWDLATVWRSLRYNRLPETCFSVFSEAYGLRAVDEEKLEFYERLSG
ncbi:aminoglycoside 3'-phosphotransferase [Alicyclobacillus shizuokensis]|uniref:aminoglycoside 3'-phosphotransferase n=1 Tax=Alicyclobacillus shizuokensis TaxID=392014 RepID=UPI0009FB855F|nr:aminoglycoside 3'-phosphotransferase [Alicyclobacillus shizuokensis]MCL6625786.1 aminoglycoside 3'-phosphotransferase [Alicyclobacillus shizuokensis]